MKKEKNQWWYVLKVVIGLTILAFVVSILISLFIGDDFKSLDGNVALIDITGIIVAENNADFLFNDVTSPDEIRKLIRKADKNDKIDAIVFRINSPGGSAVASDEIAIEIKKVNKTTVAWIREIGTSGAYWIASSTDYVIANRMSITGSIGVIASYLGFSGFLEDHNISYERLVAGDLKDIGSPFKEPTLQETALLEESLAEIHDYFIEEVANNRNLKKRDVEKIATGLFYLGIEAKKIGLVDELGSRDEVISYIEKQTGEQVHFVPYRQQKGFLSSLSKVFNEMFFYAGKGFGSAVFTQARMADSVSIWT